MSAGKVATVKTTPGSHLPGDPRQRTPPEKEAPWKELSRRRREERLQTAQLWRSRLTNALSEEIPLESMTCETAECLTVTFHGHSYYRGRYPLLYRGCIRGYATRSQRSDRELPGYPPRDLTIVSTPWKCAESPRSYISAYHGLPRESFSIYEGGLPVTVVDLVTMLVKLWQMGYLVLAREDLSNQGEGRALRRNTTEAVCRFLLEDLVCRYGCVGKITADGGELDAQEARDFFERYGLKLSLTTAYNPEGNAKSEREHPPIVKTLVKACNGRVREWPRLLPFALWADRTTHSSVTGYMPAELVQRQKPIMLVEEQIPTWSVLPWADNLTHEELLELRIRQLEQRDEDVCKALERLKKARLGNKNRFDKRHRLRPRPIDYRLSELSSNYRS
ncbi:hypothetical protein R1sor_003393 [Riccia sorocarpa]|uniref:Integrase catalytic domain-containing protein n=1 Tax=Riccia sorocarpa TaxID=122646 RepID=A0ABD3H344_9MARC